MPLPETYHSRILGSYWGLLVGDALGAPYEFKTRDSYTPTGNYERCTHFEVPLPPGSWTDDGSMALCLLASLLERDGEWDADDCVRRWVRWSEEGYLSSVNVCFDIGNATASALRQYGQHLERNSVLPSPLVANESERMSGNGSLMRLAPAPLLTLQRTPAEVAAFARATSIPTHASPLCRDACALGALYIYHLARSELPTPAKRKRAVLDPAFVLCDDKDEGTFVRRVDKIRSGEGWRGKKRAEVRTSGFVLDTLCAALWALEKFDTFEEGMMELLGMGSDVDTVCAVYGQIAGACYGVEAIPPRWLEGLAEKQFLDDFAHRLVAMASSKFV